jgi:hypothetical protein
MHQLSWGKLRREPATRWFDWSFAPMPNSDNRFARQNCFGLPSGFPLTSTWSGIVHHLSGHILCAHGISYLLLSVKQNKTNGYPGMEKFSINTEFVIPKQNSYVNFASEVYKSHWLAHKIDFLVRVSRRVLKITKQIHCWSRQNTINHFWLHHKMSYYDRIKSIRHLYETPLVYIVFLYITLTIYSTNIKYVSSTAGPLIDIITHNMVVINTRF